MDGDLGVVLGNVRHRMRSAIEHSGVKLHWQVGELPHVSYLTPHAILAVQRSSWRRSRTRCGTRKRAR